MYRSGAPILILAPLLAAYGAWGLIRRQQWAHAIAAVLAVLFPAGMSGLVVRFVWTLPSGDARMDVAYFALIGGFFVCLVTLLQVWAAPDRLWREQDQIRYDTEGRIAFTRLRNRVMGGLLLAGGVLACAVGITLHRLEFVTSGFDRRALILWCGLTLTYAGAWIGLVNGMLAAEVGDPR